MLYTSLARDFAQSRPIVQPGWQNLQELKLPEHFTVLDIGCANARLYPYLQMLFPERFDYTGLDNSVELLALAKAENYPQAELISFDLTGPVAEFSQLFVDQTFDLVTVYATWHHIPKLQHRLGLLHSIARLVKDNGYLHMSFWQFGEFNRYHRKIGFDPALVGMRDADLEPGDYIMNWERGGTAYRFCHWVRREELEKYNQLLTEHDLHKVMSYRADGKEGNQNQYVLWQKRLMD